MASWRPKKDGIKLAPISGDSSEGDIATSDRRRAKRRQANVYDAVAGRVTTTDPLKSERKGSSAKSRGGRYTLRNPTLAPEEVLFKSRRAPQRFAEMDIYFAHEALPDGGRDVLPGSDLLKAVHGYTSNFYEAVGERHGAEEGSECFVGTRLIDERSMDETALLAFGILLEEAGREVLGRRGDLVFTEGLCDGTENEELAEGSQPSHRQPREDTVGFEGGQDFWRRRLPKRRKLAEDAE